MLLISATASLAAAATDPTDNRLTMIITVTVAVLAMTAAVAARVRSTRHKVKRAKCPTCQYTARIALLAFDDLLLGALAMVSICTYLGKCRVMPIESLYGTFIFLMGANLVFLLAEYFITLFCPPPPRCGSGL